MPEAAQDSRDVHLALDSKIQYLAYSHLKAAVMKTTLARRRHCPGRPQRRSARSGQFSHLQPQ